MQANMIGAYGPWAAALVDDQPGAFSFRHAQWSDVESWRKAARQRVLERMAQPNTGGAPAVTVHRQFTYDNLAIDPSPKIYLKRLN